MFVHSIHNVVTDGQFANWVNSARSHMIVSDFSSTKICRSSSPLPAKIFLTIVERCTHSHRHPSSLLLNVIANRASTS